MARHDDTKTENEILEETRKLAIYLLALANSTRRRMEKMKLTNNRLAAKARIEAYRNAAKLIRKIQPSRATQEEITIAKSLGLSVGDVRQSRS